MIRLVRTEFAKLRTVRLPYALGAGVVFLTGLISVLIAARSGRAAGPGGIHEIVPSLATKAGLTAVVTATRFGLLFATILGVVISSGEFRHGTATPTCLGEPHRTRVMASKIFCAGVMGALLGALASGVATTSGLVFASSKGYAIALPTSQLVRYAAGAAGGAALLGAIGAGVGSLVRNQVLAVVGVFAWGLVLEEILTALFPDQARYLPFTAAFSLAGRAMGNTVMLPAWGAVSLLAGVVLAVAVIASRLTVPRDIT